MINKILCPLDGSAPARRAMAFAVDMAKKYDSELVILHGVLRKGDFSEFQQFAEVEGLAAHLAPNATRLGEVDARLDVGSMYDDRAAASRAMVEVGQHILDAAKLDAEEKGVRAVSVVLADGDPANEILNCIDTQGIDCVVMGSRGLGGIKGIFLGSVSQKVSNRAPGICVTIK